MFLYRKSLKFAKILVSIKMSLFNSAKFYIGKYRLRLWEMYCEQNLPSSKPIK